MSKCPGAGAVLNLANNILLPKSVLVLLSATQKNRNHKATDLRTDRKLRKWVVSPPLSGKYSVIITTIFLVKQLRPRGF